MDTTNKAPNEVWQSWLTLDQVPYDPEVVYPTADQSFVEYDKAYADWLATLTPAVAETPAPLSCNLWPETPARFTLIPAQDSDASASAVICELVDALEDRLSFFGSPIIVAGLYLAQVITLIAYIYSNCAGRN